MVYYRLSEGYSKVFVYLDKEKVLELVSNGNTKVFTKDESELLSSKRSPSTVGYGLFFAGVGDCKRSDFLDKELFMDGSAFVSLGKQLPILMNIGS